MALLNSNKLSRVVPAAAPGAEPDERQKPSEPAQGGPPGRGSAFTATLSEPPARGRLAEIRALFADGPDGVAAPPPPPHASSSSSSSTAAAASAAVGGAAAGRGGDRDLALSDLEVRERLLGCYSAEALETALLVAERTPDGLVTAEALWRGLEECTRLMVGCRDKTDGHHIGRSELQAYLARRKERQASCLSLPMTVLGCAVVACVIVLHLRLATVYQVSSAVETGLAAEGLAEGFPDSAWRWLGNRAGLPLAPGARVVGGARLARLPPGNSEAPLEAACGYTAWNFVYDALRTGGVPPEVRSPAGCRNATVGRAWLPWSLQGGPEVDALLASARNDWREDVNGMGLPMDGFAAQLLVYSAASDFFALAVVAVQLDDFGMPELRAEATPFDARPPWLDVKADGADGRRHVLALDLIFLCCWAALVVGDIVDFAMMCKRRGFRMACQQQATPWKAIDLVNVLVSIPSVILYLYNLYLVEGLNLLVAGLPQLEDGALATRAELDTRLADQGSSWEAYVGQLDVALEQALRAADAQAELIWYAAVLAICASLRFFEAFRANPRLNAVARTLGLVMQDLAHFLIVLVAVLAVFVVTGHMVYGSRVEAFSTPGKALGNVLLFVLRYGFDELASEMGEVGGRIGSVWLWLFNICFAIVLLNMILAIVLDQYMCIRAETHSTPSLWRQALEVLTERRRRREELLTRAARTGTAAAAWPGPAPAEVVRDGKAAGVDEALASFNESSVLRWLEDPQSHPAERVTAASLAAAMGAETWVSRAALDLLVAQAAREVPDKVGFGSCASLSDAMRLCSRVESNVCDLSSQMHLLASQLLDGQERMAAWRAGGGRPLGGVQPLVSVQNGGWSQASDDLELEDLSPPPSPPPEEDVQPRTYEALTASHLGSMAASRMGSAPGTPWEASASEQLGPEHAGYGKLITDGLSTTAVALPGHPQEGDGPTAPPLNDLGVRAARRSLDRGDPPGAQMEALELAGEQRCTRLRELCAGLEMKLVSSGVAQTTGLSASESDKLEKIEASLDKLVARLQGALGGAGPAP